jgi:hypothetical protein
MDLNELDMAAKETDIVMDDHWEEVSTVDNIQLIFETTKELISHKKRHSSNKTLNNLSEDNIQRYGVLNKDQKKIVLVKVATSHYINLEQLKKQIASIDGNESLLNSDFDLRRNLDPSYNWVFEKLSQIPIQGLAILEEIQRDLLSMSENIPFLSNYQRLALNIMRDHIRKFVKVASKEEKERLRKEENERQRKEEKERETAKEKDISQSCKT